MQLSFRVRGQKGDPLTPFMLVLVVEGLTSFMRNVYAIGEFLGFTVEKKYVVDILQFAGDT